MTETTGYDPRKKPNNIKEALQRAEYKDATTKGLPTVAPEQKVAVPIARHETPFADRAEKKTSTT